MSNLNDPRAADSSLPDPSAALSLNGTAMNAGTINPVILSLSPAVLWRQFDRLSQIPRGSGEEEPVREYLRNLAASNQISIREDQAGNIVLAVPGRGLGAGAPTVVLQGHMDMVCVKEPGKQHDFKKDPIELQLEKRLIDGKEREVLTANGTTLGADNGLGLCAAIACALDPAITNCPPLEILCTFDEERGLTGAKNLDPSIVTGRLLLNLDTEELGQVYISCAGSRDLVAEWEIARAPVPEGMSPLRVALSGLPGGHSGVEIHQKRGNAIKSVVDALASCAQDLSGCALASLEGGSKRNVIPSNCEAVLWVPSDQAPALKAALEDPRITAAIKSTLDPKYHAFRFDVTELDPAAAKPPISSHSAEKLISALSSLHNGVESWSAMKPDLVETSNNVAVIKTSDSGLSLSCMSRSSKDGAIDTLQSTLASSLRSSGAAIRFEHESPGWEADPANPLLVQAEETFTRVLGYKPEIKAIHAGLECGAFRRHIPDLKMISFGPDIKEAHTTKECAIVDSVEPFWRCLTGLLEDLASKSAGARSAN